jgi:signal transduction histidine kinase/ActR/RegA family two-component response regulator
VLKADRLARNARVIIAAGFLLVLAAILAVILSLVRSREADMLVLHTLEVQQSAQSLLICIRDAETNKRSFLLTGTPEYMESFTAAVQEIPGAFNRLRTLTADNQDQQARVEELGKLVDAKVEELERTHALIEEGQPNAALAVLNSAESRKLIGDLRDRISDVLNTERTLLAERQAKAVHERYLLAGLVAVALFFAVLLASILAGSTLQAMRGLVSRTKELETESKLRHEAESTLRQAHKMEAVGQLTGGVAHDFNNLLTIIMGNLDTIKRKVAEASNPGGNGLVSALAKPLDAAIQGTQSAAQLTHRLLAFSRRQALEPARLDLNRLITGLLDMLRRTLGADISIETVLGAGLWPVFADAHQLENALLNLALNAKDAMPNGGCLTIETANTYLDDAYVRRFGDLEVGQYVVLCVTDTGTGIPKDDLHRVFEPFFTTKPTGEGSGLGLAMVHGFVKQSGGHVRIYSEEGHGTTAKIYLPRLINVEEISAAPVGKAAELAPVPRARTGETILVVEDNEGVREYAKEVLEDLGYGALTAADANQGVEVFARARRVDLLFTDVVLPGGVNGRELATRLRERNPALPVLYTTGYTRNAIVHQGRLDADVELLNKPYTQQDLARKLRAMLDAGASPRRAG